MEPGYETVESVNEQELAEAMLAQIMGDAEEGDGGEEGEGGQHEELELDDLVLLAAGARAEKEGEDGGDDAEEEEGGPGQHTRERGGLVEAEREQVEVEVAQCTVERCVGAGLGWPLIIVFGKEGVFHFWEVGGIHRPLARCINICQNVSCRDKEVGRIACLL